MKKLIELLDQYRKQNPREFFGDEGSLVVLTGKDFIELNRLLIISKEFGFIKWLVDNDKIDIEKVIDTAKSSVIDTYYYEEGIDDIYIPLLMVLAVEDEPIEFLISILK